MQEAGCPFCDEEAVEPSIIAESAALLLIVHPRPLTAGHLLLTPRRHLPCYGTLPAALEAEVLRMKRQVALFLEACYGEPAFFEHYAAEVGGGHARLHAVPLLAGRDALLATLGPRPAVPAPDLSALHACWESHRSYLYWEERGQGLVLEPGPLAPGALERALGALLPRPAAPPDGRELAPEVRRRWQQHLATRTGAEIGLVACVLRRAERICLLLRSPALASAPGKWHVVTGYLPDGVAPLEHAYREVEQETGLAAHQLRLERQAPPLLLQREGDARRWRVHPFLFEITAGEPRLNWEHVDLRWATPSEVARFDTVGWLPRLLNALLEPPTEP